VLTLLMLPDRQTDRLLQTDGERSNGTQFDGNVADELLIIRRVAVIDSVSPT